MIHSADAAILLYGKSKRTPKKARQERIKAAQEAILANTESTSNIYPEGETLESDHNSFKRNYPPLFIERDI